MVTLDPPTDAYEHIHWCDECKQYECSICYDETAYTEVSVAAHIVRDHEKPWSDD